MSVKPSTYIVAGFRMFEMDFNLTVVQVIKSQNGGSSNFAKMF